MGGRASPCSTGRADAVQLGEQEALEALPPPRRRARRKGPRALGVVRTADRVALRDALLRHDVLRVGVGRIIVSEIAATNLLVNLESRR